MFNSIKMPKIFRDAGFVFSGEVFNIGFGFLLTVVVSRHLGPAEFGLFSVALAFLVLVAGLMDFGVNTALVRFVSLALKQKQLEKTRRILSIAWRFKLVLGTAVFCSSWWLARPLALIIFRQADLIRPLQLALMGVAGILLLEFAVATLQAYQWFARRFLVNLVIGLGRLVIVSALVYAGRGDLNRILAWYVFWPWAGVAASLFFIPPGFIVARWERSAARELFHFSKWLMLAGLATILFNRLDVFMLTSLAGAGEAGIYAAAYRLASLLLLLSGALGTMLLPKVAALTTGEQIKRYLGRVASYLTFIVALCLPLFWWGGAIVGWFYGPAYARSAAVFPVLLLAFILVLIAAPVNIIIYALNRPQILVLLAGGELVISFTGNYLLIPGWGAAGAAWALLAVRIFTLGFLLTYLLIKIPRIGQGELSAEEAVKGVLQEEIALGG